MSVWGGVGMCLSCLKCAGQGINLESQYFLCTIGSGVELTSSELYGCFYPVSFADPFIHFCHNSKIYVW